MEINRIWDFSFEILKNMKNDIIETVQKSTTNRFKIHKVVEIPKLMDLIPNINISTTNHKKLTDYFYEVTQLSKLDIYVDFIHIDYKEKRIYDDEIKSYYLPYTQLCMMYFICLPIVLPMDLCRWVYNNLIIYPFVSIKYRNNPLYYSFTINIFLRKSLVEKTK